MKLPEITLDWLKKKGACFEGYRYCAEVKITEPLALIQRLIEDDHNDWANWIISRITDHKQKIAYAVYAAELVLPIFEKKYPDDLHPRKAIEATKKCLECDSDENRLLANHAAFPTNDNYFVCAAAYEARNAAYYAAKATISSSAYAYCAADYAYFAASAANKCEKGTYAKILAYGIDLLTKES